MFISYKIIKSSSWERYWGFAKTVGHVWSILGKWLTAFFCTIRDLSDTCVVRGVRIRPLQFLLVVSSHLWRQNPQVVKGNEKHPTVNSHTSISTIPIHTTVFHMAVIFRMIYTFRCTLGAIWPVMCWCRVKPSKTDHLPGSYRYFCMTEDVVDKNLCQYNIT